MKILYITMSKKGPKWMHLDPSVIYRCVNPAFQLQRAGHRVWIAHADELPKKHLKPDVVIFHRPRFTAEFAKALQQYSDARLIADYDDLLFDFATMDSHPGLVSGRMSKRILEQETNDYYRALKYFDDFTVSTEPLKMYLQATGVAGLITVIPNGLDPRWVNIGNQFEVKTNQDKTISYFAGTSNHDKDLAQCIQELDEFVLTHPDYHIDVYGSIDPVALGVRSSQWRAAKNVPYFLLPHKIKQSWVSIAPLKQTPFNLCKSGLKFFESGIFGKPLVASPLPDFKRFMNHGIGLVQSEGQWLHHLNRLVDESEYELASNTALLSAKKCTTERTTNILLNKLGLTFAEAG